MTRRSINLELDGEILKYVIRDDAGRLFAKYPFEITNPTLAQAREIHRKLSVFFEKN